MKDWALGLLKEFEGGLTVAAGLMTWPIAIAVTIMIAIRTGGSWGTAIICGLLAGLLYCLLCIAGFLWYLRVSVLERIQKRGLDL